MGKRGEYEYKSDLDKFIPLFYIIQNKCVWLTLIIRHLKIRHLNRIKNVLLIEKTIPNSTTEYGIRLIDYILIF